MVTAKIKWKPHVSLWDKVSLFEEISEYCIFYRTVEGARKGSVEGWNLEDEVWVVWSDNT